MKKIKFPILLKVILAGILVSFVASGVSILVSYNNQIKIARQTYVDNIDNSIDYLNDYYSTADYVTNLSDIVDYVLNGTDSTDRGYEARKAAGEQYTLTGDHFHNDFAAFESYYRNENSFIYDNGSPSMSLPKAKFQGKYFTLLSALTSAKTTSNSVAVYAAFEKDNYLIFLGDSRQASLLTDESHPYYQIAGTDYLINDTDRITKDGEGYYGYYIFGKTTRLITIYMDEAQTQEVAKIFIEYDDSSVIAGVRAVIRTESIIIGITAIFIVLVYALLSYFLFVRNINKLSKISKDISYKLEKNSLKEPINIKVRSRDEMADLATSLNVLQTAVYNYSELVHKEAKEKERMNAELEVASKIQLEALPPFVYKDEKVTLRAYMKAAKEVGGDFYDYFYLDENRFVVLIADVSGKGIPASLFMMRSKAIIKNEILANDNLESAIYKANNILVNNNSENLFVTAFIGIIDLAKQEMRYINCGHEKPYVFSNKKVNKIEGTSNFVIGEVEDFNYKEESIKFKDDDTLFMFTDGLNESINKYKEEFGYTRIEELLSSNNDLSLEELFKVINEKHNEFIGKEQQFDDITMISIRKGDNKLNINYDQKDYKIIEDATEKFLATFSYLNEETKAHVGIVLDELLNNLISYEKREDLQINLDFEYINNKLKITITSNGVNYDPFRNHKVKNQPDDNPGGYGILLVKQFTKKQEYKYIDKHSIITLYL